MVGIVAAVAVVATITIVLITSGGDTPAQPSAGSTVSTPAAPTGQPTTGGTGGRGGPSGGTRPLPPPTPTGNAYDDEPAVGACVDIARGETGLVLYQADCGDPAASLILDNIQPDKCASKGFWGLRGFSGQILCFTHAVSPGDCIDLNLPRRAACTPGAPTGPKSKIKITEIHRGAHDGTQCANPTQFVEVGKDADRGIACYTPIPAGSAGNPTPIPSR